MNQQAIQPVGTVEQKQHSVLGEKATKIPTAGKIRSGIMVLTADAAKNQKAKELYDAGLAQGTPWGAIEKSILAATGLTKKPLRPINVPYFTVREADFAMPEVPRTIMQMYGEDRGEGKHLYRFPVIFPVDSWVSVIPHSLSVFTRNERVFWSDYDNDGKRHCYTHAKPVANEQNKRAKRYFGGRPIALRQENGGVCDPERCQQYQERLCNLTGKFIFYVPGAHGLGAIQLPTKSFYSMEQARETLNMVLLVHGKISGTFEGKPIFYLTKKQEEVSMIDENGQPKKVKQWLIKLEADIDMSQLFVSREAPARLEAGGQAAAALGAPVGMDVDDDDEAEELPPVVTHVPESEPEVPNDPEAVKALRLEMSNLARNLGIDMAKLQTYGDNLWGEGWAKREITVSAVVTTLRNAQVDPDLLTAITGGDA